MSDATAPLFDEVTEATDADEYQEMVGKRLATLSLLLFFWDSRVLLATAESLAAMITSFYRSTIQRGNTRVTPTFPYGAARILTASLFGSYMDPSAFFFGGFLLYLEQAWALVVTHNSKIFSSHYDQIDCAVLSIRALQSHSTAAIIPSVFAQIEKLGLEDPDELEFDTLRQRPITKNLPLWHQNSPFQGKPNSVVVKVRTCFKLLNALLGTQGNMSQALHGRQKHIAGLFGSDSDFAKYVINTHTHAAAESIWPNLSEGQEKKEGVSSLEAVFT